MYIAQDDGTLLHEADSPPGKLKANGKNKTGSPTRAESPNRIKDLQYRKSRQEVLETDATGKIQR